MKREDYNMKQRQQKFYAYKRHELMAKFGYYGYTEHTPYLLQQAKKEKEKKEK